MKDRRDVMTREIEIDAEGTPLQIQEAREETTADGLLENLFMRYVNHPVLLVLS